MASSAFYDIDARQHETFDLNLEFLDDTEGRINLSSYSARFHVRPNYETNVRYLQADTSGVTVGLTGASGGVYLNVSETGSGLTGGLRILIDSESMGNIPVGNWFYSLELSAGLTTEEVMRGRFVVMPKVTI